MRTSTAGRHRRHGGQRSEPRWRIGAKIATAPSSAAVLIAVGHL